jgi:hypothetical protein
MFAQNKARIVIFVAILSLVAAWLPVSVQAQRTNAAPQAPESLPNGLQESVKAALGSNYRPMQFPSTQQAKLLAADKAYKDGFGYSVAVSSDGNTALIGTPAEDDSGTTANGAAYVFIRAGNVWTQQAKFLAADKANRDLFGWSVALSSDGDTALIGAYLVSGSGTTYNGAAYVFTRTGSTWTQQAKLLAADKASGDQFGWSVALSSDGDTALIGANEENDSGTNNNGAAYIFIRAGSTWTQQAKLLAADKVSLDFFGHSVAVSSNGNTALIGAYREDDSSTTDSGAAYVFTRTDSTWTQQAKLLAADKADSDRFGSSIAVSSDGNTTLIGAYQEEDSGTTYNGAAYVFTRAGNTWTQQAKLLAADKANANQFGYSVAVSGDGNTALIGAYQEAAIGTLDNSAAYIFIETTPSTTTNTPTSTPTNTLTESFTPTYTPSNTPTETFTPSDTPTNTLTPSNTATNTYTPSNTPTNTPTETFTPTYTPTNTPTHTLIPLHPDTIGVYDAGVWYLRNTNNAGNANIIAAFGGVPSDLPVVGDWNSNGVDTIGVYRSSTGFFLLSDSNTSPAVNYTVLFGNPGDTPFAGRWTPDMTGSGIGVYRNSNGILYQRKSLTSGTDDFFAVFGNPGDQGVAGDWDGNGFDSIGIYRASSQTWFMTNNSTPGGITFSDIDFVWTIGDNLPVVGDWDGDGDSTVGYLTASGVFVLHPNNAAAGTDNTFAFGPANSKPIAGKWTSASNPSPRGVIAPITGVQPGGSNADSGDGD